MRAILSSGAALSTLAVITPAWGQADAVAGERPEALAATDRTAASPQAYFTAPGVIPGFAWDLAEAPLRPRSNAFPVRPFIARHQAENYTTYRLRVADGSLHVVSGTIGGPRGSVRFTYRGGYTRGGFGKPDCGDPGSAGDCGGFAMPAERTARVHQGGLERNWQGLVEGTWNLGSGHALIVSGGLGKARRTFDEAHALPDGVSLPTAAIALGSDMLGASRQKEKVATMSAATRLALVGLTFTPGLRYDRARQRIFGFRTEDGAGGTAIQQRRTFAALLPSMTLDTAPSSQTALQLRWSRETARAELIALAPGIAVERGSGQAWVGNPDLRPSRTDSFELAGQWHPEVGGILDVTLFTRLADDPVIASVSSRTDAMIAGHRYDRLTLTRAVNARSGRESGIEVRYRRDLSFLPPALGTLALEMAAGYSQARATLPGDTLRQPRRLYAATVSWRRGTVEGVLSWTGMDGALLATGESLSRSGSQQQLGARARLAISRDCRIFVEGQNLADAPTLQVRDTLRRWTIASERYSRTVIAGLWAQF